MLVEVMNESGQTRTSGWGEKLIVYFQSLQIEANELDDFNAASRDVLANCLDRDSRCAVGWKRINAGADGGKCDGVGIVLPSEFEAATVAAREETVFVAIASMPDRTDGVEDPLGG